MPLRDIVVRGFLRTVASSCAVARLDENALCIELEFLEFEEFDEFKEDEEAAEWGGVDEMPG